MSCDCCDYYKYKYCKHIIALNLQNGRLTDPEIEKKKKRGRKSKITKALQR